ncbi:MAG TPA: ELM1/GtrOC1 family putative glycosyltransferase [Candidatus Acidoferrum sp.]|nr:ELM1/GtrOC1 family putative glycosyltransferase [Candidatus Acidoferrum sp.]
MSAPSVWILLADRAGGNGQLISLAEALGWPYERKAMAYNWLNRCPNILLGATLATTRRSSAEQLQPPWPDLVIGASRRSVPVARWIRQQAGGRTKLVHLLHAMAPLDLFDLVITTPQYRLPQRTNVLHLAAALNRIDAQRLAAAHAAWTPRLDRLPRPLTALFVGGNSATYRLDAATAARLGAAASAAVAAAGGTLLVSTSPRTPPDAAEAAVKAIACRNVVYRWKANDPDNPYHAFLALADRFIVTADSASQLVEACLMGKPVEVFSWPMRRSPLLWVKEWLWRRYDAGGALAGAVDRLVYWGLLKPPRDFAALHRALRDRGLITAFGERAAAARRPLDDMERAVAAIRALFSRS